MAQVAERLIILTDIGEGLLIRLYNTRNKLEGPTKPAFLTDPALQKGRPFQLETTLLVSNSVVAFWLCANLHSVLSALGRKFPELATDVEKVQQKLYLNLNVIIINSGS